MFGQDTEPLDMIPRRKRRRGSDVQGAGRFSKRLVKRHVGQRNNESFAMSPNRRWGCLFVVHRTLYYRLDASCLNRSRAKLGVVSA